MQFLQVHHITLPSQESLTVKALLSFFSSRSGKTVTSDASILSTSKKWFWYSVIAYSRCLACVREVRRFPRFFGCFVEISLTFLFGMNRNVILLTYVNICIYIRDPYLFFHSRMPIYEINRKKKKFTLIRYTQLKPLVSTTSRYLSPLMHS